MKFSIGKKATILIIVIALLVSIVEIIGTNEITKRLIEKQYEERSVDIATAIAVAVDPEATRKVRDAVLAIYEATPVRVTSEEWGSDAFYAYLANYSAIEEMPEFIAIRDALRVYLDRLDVESVYISYIDEDRRCSIYIVDAGYEDACPPGCIDPLYAALEDLTSLDHPEEGIRPTVTNTPEYGWLVASGMPIFDKQGNVIAHLAVDLSMNEIAAVRNRYYSITVAILAGIMFVIILLGVFIVNRVLVRPINVLSDASSKYYDDGEEITRHKFENLRIHTGDELEILADSMKKMEKDINDHIERLVATSKKLEMTREQADKMSALANVDALTHVKNKRAYTDAQSRINKDIKNGATAVGIAMIDLNNLKVINDEHGHEKGDTAIMNLCHVVCEIFKHSPVYRVGGDEFVVILRNHDFDHAEELIGEFIKKIEETASDESLEPWDRISAALGYAVYAEEDGDLQTVLKRADDLMYERKKAMKEAML